MKYHYADLSPKQFEDLVVLLCQKLFGIGAQGFAEGPDGGRDAKFVGTAECFPSKTEPWKGVTIIQAKHTNGFNSSFSDTDFFSASGKNTNTVIGKDIPRIRELRESGKLDNYLLISNRRLSANKEQEIREYIAKECAIPEKSIHLVDVEQLERWLKTWPDIPGLANLDPVDSPLIVSPDDLAEVVEALFKAMHGIPKTSDEPPVPRVPYEEKNKTNNMTEDYAKLQRKRYLQEQSSIKRFLADPQNIEILRKYESVVEEFQFKITAKRKDYQTFDNVMNYLADLLFNIDNFLRSHKQLTRSMLFYMYWNCDIGKENDATSE